MLINRSSSSKATLLAYLITHSSFVLHYIFFYKVTSQRAQDGFPRFGL